MGRVLEPEVMDDPEGARAYAGADFAAVNQAFVAEFLDAHPAAASGAVLDLGCGPADIPLRLARAADLCRVSAVDASEPMLALGREALVAAGLAERVELVLGRVPGLALAPSSFDAVISNSLLHHLPDPAPFWAEIRRLGKPGAALFVQDLARPDSVDAAQNIVEREAADEPEVLKADFYNSLLAAFTPDEVRAQLAAAGIEARLETPSDRHWRVVGRLP